MATDPNCCGCHLVDDYGTSFAHGTGSSADPFTIEQVDPTFQRPFVRVFRGTQALSAGVVTTLAWTTEVFDSAAMWSPGAPTEIVLPISQGLYLVGLQANFAATAGFRELIIQQNGVPIYSTEYQTAIASEMVVSYLVHLPGNVSGAVRSDVGVTLNQAVLWAVYIGKKV